MKAHDLTSPNRKINMFPNDPAPSLTEVAR